MKKLLLVILSLPILLTSCNMNKSSSNASIYSSQQASSSSQSSEPSSSVVPNISMQQAINEVKSRLKSVIGTTCYFAAKNPNIQLPGEDNWYVYPYNNETQSQAASETHASGLFMVDKKTGKIMYQVEQSAEIPINNISFVKLEMFNDEALPTNSYVIQILEKAGVDANNPNNSCGCFAIIERDNETF